MSLREAAQALLNDYDSIEPGDGVVIARWPEMEALREALAEEGNVIAKLTEERDMWARKWQEERRRHAELRFPGMHGKIKALSVEAEAVVKIEAVADTFLDQIVEAKRDLAEWPQWMKDSAHISAAVAHPPAALPESFAEWVRKNMPAGTVIGDPEWWIPRLQRAAVRGKE